MEEVTLQYSWFHKVDKYRYFTFIYDEVKALYSKDNGRTSIVIRWNKYMFKQNKYEMFFISHLFSALNIKS